MKTEENAREGGSRAGELFRGQRLVIRGGDHQSLGPPWTSTESERLLPHPAPALASLISFEISYNFPGQLSLNEAGIELESDPRCLPTSFGGPTPCRSHRYLLGGGMGKRRSRKIHRPAYRSHSCFGGLGGP